MRTRLRWDVVFVVEHDDLRRLRDEEHYRLARELRRTLITLDRYYLDDLKFLSDESGGVLVLAAPEEKGYMALLARLDAELLRQVSLPLYGCKLHVNVDWRGGNTIKP